MWRGKLALSGRLVMLVVGALLIAACSERGSSAIAPPTAVARIEPSFETKSLQELSSQVAAGGIPTTYDAYFDQQQLKGILEERQEPVGIGQGEYVYMGARLLQYRGSTLRSHLEHDSGTIELKFDLQGRLESARALRDPTRTVEPSQIDAIRARGQLLRSHALAQRSLDAHRTEGHGGY